jgi:hypothetical protein
LAVSLRNTIIANNFCPLKWALYSKEKMQKYVRLSQIGCLYRENEDSYFHPSFDELHDGESFERFLSAYENDLAKLDDNSWEYLKEETEKLCIYQDKNKRWTPLFDKLNEARGYVFLKSLGCKEIAFIRPSKKGGEERPDLKGEKEGSSVLCEVKTKHISDVFINARDNSRVIRTNEILADKLKSILKDTFEKAGSQLNAMPESSKYEKWIYLIINYDNQEVDASFPNKLNSQTRLLFNSMDMGGLKLAIHNEK